MFQIISAEKRNFESDYGYYDELYSNLIENNFPSVPDDAPNVNVTEFYSWMKNCSDFAARAMVKLFGNLENIQACSALTFSWIR